MREENNDTWVCGALIALGVVVIVIGTGLVGHLLTFMYDERKYFFVGLIALTFVGTISYVFSEFHRIQTLFEKQIESKLTVLEAKVVDVHFDRKVIQHAIDDMRRSVDLQWGLCKKSFQDVDRLMTPKPPILVEVPKPLPTIEPNLQQAIQEVVGGAR